MKEELKILEEKQAKFLELVGVESTSYWEQINVLKKKLCKKVE